MGAEEGGGVLRPHAVMAVYHHTAFGIGGESFKNLRKGTQRDPLVAVNLADGEFVVLSAIDEPRPLVRGKPVPFRDGARADFQRGFRIRQGFWKSRAHSTMTGVPTETFSKNFSDMWCGMRMQPWDAAYPGR